MTDDVLLLGGNANPRLTKHIAECLGVPLGDSLVSRFSDGEIRVEIGCNVRGNDVYIVQPTCYPANDNLMEALVMVDACKRASAGQITFVAPYFGYARQERKSSPRTPITAKLVADLLEAAGIDRMLTVELHNSAIQGFFNLPVDHLFSKRPFVDYFKGLLGDNVTVVSPDAGGVERARAVAKEFGCGIAIIDKRRDRPNDSAVMNIVGDINGLDCLIVDDIVDTGGSLVKAAEALLANGAKTVAAAITHPVLSASSVSLIDQSPLQQLVVSDTIPLSEDASDCDKIVQVSVAPLLADAIKRIHNRDSISSLFV